MADTNRPRRLYKVISCNDALDAEVNHYLYSKWGYDVEVQECTLGVRAGWLFVYVNN